MEEIKADLADLQIEVNKSGENFEKYLGKLNQSYKDKEINLMTYMYRNIALMNIAMTKIYKRLDVLDAKTELLHGRIRTIEEFIIPKNN